MSEERRQDDHLPHLLLLVSVAELVVYRILVPALRPGADAEVPPWWHGGLSYLGLYLFYFSAALAVAYIARVAIGKFRSQKFWDLHLAAPLLFFLCVATYTMVTLPTADVTILLEICFCIVAIRVAIGSFFSTTEDASGSGETHKGDWGLRIGLVLLVLPFLAHAWGTLDVRYLSGGEALWDGSSEKVERLSRWLVLLCALATPYALGPRPFFLRAARIGPLLAGMSVAFLGSLILRNNYEYGMQLAENGLGFSLGPAPTSFIALCLMGLSALVWTVSNCLISESPARRQVGIGLSLVVLGGFSFAWGSQYLLDIAGLMLIAEVSSRVKAEEKTVLTVLGPAIDDERWQEFCVALVADIRRDFPSEGSNAATVVTVASSEEVRQSHLAFRIGGRPAVLTFERVDGKVLGVDLRIGDAATDEVPVMTLHRRGDARLSHPLPPFRDGKKIIIADEVSRREHVVTCEGLAMMESIIDDEMHTSQFSHELGWVAIYKSGTLRAQWYPGRGVSQDDPIPTRALADSQEASPERLMACIHWLAKLAEKAKDALGTQSEEPKPQDDAVNKEQEGDVPV